MREEIRRYLETDRAGITPTPWFAGREAEMAVFERQVAAVARGDVAGRTLLLQGAPGAGKSELLNRYAARVRGSENRQGSREIFPVRMIGTDFNSIWTILFRIDQIVSGARTSAALREFLGERGLSVSFAGFEVGVGGRARTPPDAATELLGACSERWKGANIVLLVDEAQNIPINDETRQVLGALHGGESGARVLAAFFGLSNTREVLRRGGISRLSDGHVLDLPPLAPEEAGEAVRAAFRLAGVHGPEEVRERWIMQLARASQGWPQHLALSLKTALSALECDGLDTRGTAPEMVLRTIEQGKGRYYEARLEGVDHWRPLYLRLAAGAEQSGRPARFTRRRLQDAAWELCRREALPFSELLSDSLHAGILSGTEGLFGFPIPSLVSHLAARWTPDAGDPILPDGPQDELPKPAGPGPPRPDTEGR